MSVSANKVILAAILCTSQSLLTAQTNHIDVIADPLTNNSATVLQTNASTNMHHGKTIIAHLRVDPQQPSSIDIAPVQKSFSEQAGKFFKDVFGIGKVTHIFNGEDLETFYPWLLDAGTYVDKDRVFRVEDGLLHITGQHQGFIATKHQFSDFKLIVEYKWGKQTFYKHKETPPNSGIFINATGLDGIDMKSIEVQLQEGGNSGNIVLHGGASLTVGKETKRKPWSEFNNSEASKWERVGDWNKLEILCEGNRLRVILNGHVTIDGYQVNPTRGKILVQSNGAEIFFRRIDLYDMNTNSALPALPVINNSEKESEPAK